MMRGMGNMGNMMKQMKKMEKQLAEEQKVMESKDFTGVSPDELVKTTFSGKRVMKHSRLTLKQLIQMIRIC